MFENLNISNTPNNLCRTFTTDCNNINKCSCKLPYEEYNVAGEFVGYSWNYGDTVTLQFNIEGELTLESDAIIYTAQGSMPTITTRGTVGQKAYNTTDVISWVCTSVNASENIYNWEQEEVWQAPLRGSNVYVTVKDYLKGKYFTIHIYNFRHEKEFTSLPIPAQELFTFNIDSKMVESPCCNSNGKIKTEVQYEPLSRGIHYLNLILIDENNEYVDTLIGQQDCTLIIE